MESSINMLEKLDDHCLYEILEQKCIDIDELCELKETCPHLEGIAVRAFRKNFKQTDENNNSVMTSWPLEKIVKCLRHFGEHFTTFCLDGHDCSVPRMLADYCQNIVNLQGNSVCDIALKGFYSRLEQFDHSRGRFDGSSLFDDSSALTHLTLAHCEAVLPDQCLSQLKHVKLVRVQLHPENLVKFAQQNDQISSLEVSNINDSFQGAIEHLVNLKELTYMFNAADREPTTFACFEGLTKLEILKVHLSTESIRNVLNALHTANAPLTSLTMTYSKSDQQVIETICQLKGIRTLHFEYDRRISFRTNYIHSVNGRDLQQIGDQLPHLSDLVCESDDVNVRDILMAIKNAKHLERAHFKISEFDYERESENIQDISALASKRQIFVTIEIFDRLVSDLIIN